VRGRRFGERGLELHHVEAIEHVESEVALERRDAYGLHDAAGALEGLGCRLHGRRDLGVDRAEAGLDQPTDPEGAIWCGTHPASNWTVLVVKASAPSGPARSE
jgi:hypothetical protein